jgi:hypothetical protein
LIPSAVLFAAALVGGFLFPWWWPALAAYAAGYWLGRTPWRAFLTGFLGTGLAWAALAAFLDWRNAHVLAHRMAGLIGVPAPWVLLVLTALVGGLMGGLGALAGQALRAYILARRREDDLGPA